MSYESMAQDVLKFLDSENIDKIILVGHSMGGKVAQTIALLKPELVEGLVVLDMAPVAYESNEPHWKAVTGIIETLQSVPTGDGASKQTVDRHLQSAIPDPALRGFCLTNWNVKGKTWAIPVYKIAHQLDTLAAFDITPATGTYAGDVFFIHGGQSKFVRSAHMPTIAQYFPNHMLTTIRGAGHWVHAEAPDDTIALLKRYLDWWQLTQASTINSPTTTTTTIATDSSSSDDECPVDGSPVKFPYKVVEKTDKTTTLQSVQCQPDSHENDDDEQQQ